LKNLILYIGTPRIFIETIDYLKSIGLTDVCVFTYEENNEWMVEETFNVKMEKYRFTTEEIYKEFSGYEQLNLEDKVIFLYHGNIENKDIELLKKIFDMHYMYTKSELKDETISKLTYSMTGIETFIGSLLEPLEPEELLSILNDAFGELLLSSSALFRNEGDYFKMIHDHGFNIKIADIKTNKLNSTPLYFSFPVNLETHSIFSDCEEELKKINACFAIPVIIDEKVEYTIIIGRAESITEEEKVIINSLSRVLSKILEYHLLKGKSDLEKKDIEKSNFRLLSFYKGLGYLFSRNSTMEFSIALSDMVKEVFQLEDVKIFARKNWGNLLWDSSFNGESNALISKYSSVWDVYNLKKANEYEAFNEDFGNSAIFFENNPVKEYDGGVFASVIRSIEGYVLGVAILYGFEEKDKDFLSMLCSMSGLALNSLLLNNDFSKIARSYEEIMAAFQNAHSLYKELQKSSGIVDFYNRLKKILERDFSIYDVYMAFETKDKIITLPGNVDEYIMNAIKRYIEYSEADLIAITNPNTERILYVQPLNIKYKKIVIIFEAKDDAKINIILQLIQLGFKDTLARVISEERF